jgi:hypothetical protein
MKTKWVTCKKCNRILWEEDADKDGLCVDCRPAAAKLRLTKPNDKKKDG